MERPEIAASCASGGPKRVKKNTNTSFKAFSLRRGLPASAAGRESLQKAEQRMKEFKPTAFSGGFDYPSNDLLESESWWYIPQCGVGCFGFIVDKQSGYVDWLGSG